jgi:arylsulfatase A-like enzyme
MKRILSGGLLLALAWMTSTFGATRPPSIVVILADDVGYGDVGCYGAARVDTPNIDRLAKEGLRFTDAHATSATCTPSRYALLTGEYPWRKRGTGILPGDAALIIEPGRTTVASLLQKAGYSTGVVGKWHLGLGAAGGLDWNGEIKPGPREIGFNYSFILPATGDRVPCVYLENQRVVGLDTNDPIRVSYAAPVGNEPTGKEHPELLVMHPSVGHSQTIINGISRIGYMSGGRSARWKDEDIADVLTRKAAAFINKHKANPFFLYFATHDIHVPRVPHPRFVGKTGMGPRGDAIAQLDWSVGQILDTLEKLNLATNTLVMFTSDNGPVVDDGYKDAATEKLGGHKPAGPLRGGKTSIFEGGNRVPFIVRWPGRVNPGTSSALLCQVDLLHSFASLAGQSLAEADGPDSFNVLSALLGDSVQGRASLVEHAGTLALRQGTLKFIEPKRKLARAAASEPDGSSEPDAQLFDLATDLGEAKNLSRQNPALVEAAAEELEKIRKAGRSRP